MSHATQFPFGLDTRTSFFTLEDLAELQNFGPGYGTIDLAQAHPVQIAAIRADQPVEMFTDANMVPGNSLVGMGGLGIVDYFLSKKREDKRTEHTRSRAEAGDAALQAQIDALKAAAGGSNTSPPSSAPAAAPSTLKTLGLLGVGLVLAAAVVRAVRG